MKIPVKKNIIFNPDSGDFEALPEVLNFSIDKKILTDETPAIVTWEVINASLVYLNDELVPSKGEKVFYTTDLLIITLNASNPAGDAEPRKLALDIERKPPKIHFFSVDIESTIEGEPIRLSWQVEGAAKLEIDNDIGDVTGLDHKNTTLEKNGIFNLEASNYFGFTTKKTADIRDFPVSSDENIVIEEPDFKFRPISLVQPDFTFKNIRFELPDFNHEQVTIDPSDFNIETNEDMGIKKPIITEAETTVEVEPFLKEQSLWSIFSEFLTKIGNYIWNRK